MSGGSEAVVRQGRFTYFPVVPGKLEFAAELRKFLLAERPQIVALELPWHLERYYRRAIARLPQMSMILYADPEDEERLIYLPVEPADPFTEGVRSAMELDAELVFIEPGLTERPHLPDRYPDPYSIRHIGLDAYVREYRRRPGPRSPAVQEHARGMAWKLQGANPLANVVVVVSLNLLGALLDAMEEPQEAPEEARQYRSLELVHPHPESLAEITVEMPYLQDRYEQYRLLMEPSLTDRPRVQYELLREAEIAYEKNAGERLAHWQRRQLAKFARNLALANGELCPGLFDLTVAARSLVDDNYAWEVWEAASRYPSQRETSELQVVNPSGDEVWLHTRKLRLRRRLPRPKQRLRPASLKPHQKEKKAGEWAEQLDGDAICSYPPEDLVVEDYGRFLKQKGQHLLSAEQQRSEKFTTSLLDGLDLRETVRHWHEGGLYVQQLAKRAGDVGSVVVIFDEDRQGRYSYLTTWLGENQNESDMAFYSTPPFDHMIGPGIGRAEYGGFLMSLPPRRMFDVWGDPDYQFAETKAERLLLAALDYSVHRYVVYAATKPPRSVFRSVAAQMNRSIIYLPLGQLNADKLKKVRVVHVLDGHERRKTAKDYLW